MSIGKDAFSLHNGYSIFCNGPEVYAVDLCENDIIKDIIIFWLVKGLENI